uniref:Uncharacterized protein n=1 Tax=Ditylenchus dipsaci TaxID=166011 RepID=A0A915CY11_9BILA
MIKSNDQGRHSTRRIILAMDKFLSGSNSSLQYLDVSFVIYRYQNFYLGDSKNPFVNARPSASKSPTVVSTRRERCIPGYFDADHSVGMATIDSDENFEVLATIKYSKKVPPLHGQYKVAWWTKNAEWARTNTCNVVNDREYLVAQCDHLTDFTLLVDGMETDPSLCDECLITIDIFLILDLFSH